MGLKDWVDLLISLVIGLIGTLTNVTVTAGSGSIHTGCKFLAKLLLFVLNIQAPYLTPNTIDINSSATSPRLVTYPLWNNLLLLSGFGLQHSGMLRGPAKYLQRLIFSKENTKVFYVAVTCAYFWFLFSFWAPMPHIIWDVQQEQLKVLVYVACLSSWFFVVLSLLTLDPWTLLGIKTHLDKALNRPKGEVHLVTTGLYGLMRHPIYSFLMLGIWIIPTMTVGHLLFSAVLTGYILFAVAQFEEPELAKEIGAEYEEYMKTTPRYIPNFPGRSSSSAGKTD